MRGEGTPRNGAPSRPRDSAGSWLASLVGALAIVACAGCAHRGVPVESRPTPPQPTSATEVPPTSATAQSAAEVPPAAVNARATRVAADTTAVSSALRKCAGRKLLPDQEGVYEATTRLLVETRAAMAREDWSRAESSARQARQLAGSLTCY